MMIRPVCVLSACLVAASIAGAQVVVEPSTVVQVPSSRDYATEVLQDPWDMNEQTDVGWFLFGANQPRPNLDNVQFSEGIFSATSSTGDPSFFLLDSYIPGTAGLGKVGSNFPINADIYTHLAFRMRADAADNAQLVWSRDSMYDDQTLAYNIPVKAGWHTYVVDLRTLNRLEVSPPVTAWDGTKGSLRFDPTTRSGEALQFDWFRLVENEPSEWGTVAWTGGGSVDIHLDNDSNAANGTLGTVARDVSGGSYNLFVGALPAGAYWVAVVPAGGSPAAQYYSPGHFEVGCVPTLRFTSPSEEGSADDFATVVLGNPWDMDSLADLDYTRGVTNLQITNRTAVDTAGELVGSTRVLQGTSAVGTGGVGDPELYTLWSTERGSTWRIDPDRYRILTAEMGLPGPRDLVAGSIARIVWKLASESQENVSADIVVNHKSGTDLTLTRLIADMKTMPLETDPGGSPSTSGWVPGTGPNPGIDNFRLDPHEFADPTDFFVRRIKLAALERVGSHYTVEWDAAGVCGSGATLSLYYDTDRIGFNGTLIAHDLDLLAGSYDWNTNSLPVGEYHLYGEVVSGGTVVNRAYAPWPVIKESGDPAPTLEAAPGQLYFGGTANGTLITSDQQVAVTVSGGSGVSWTATANHPAIEVGGGAGVDSGTLTVGIRSGTGASFTSSVTVSAPGTLPVHVQVQYTYAASTGGPFGVFDTPVDNTQGVVGSVPVTGWALDDVEVEKVDIWRDPMVGEPTHPNGKVYIGDAVFVDGARPDVAALYPTHPLNTRAGWGYLMLTNMLPNQGNGTFRIHAYATDREGRATYLGAKRISCDNANATKPFGTIDTPAQGETISGSAYVNFGWALTPQPAKIPEDGSTIVVYVDGVPLGNPVYGLSREDIDTLFPGLQNSGAAVGYFVIDTTQLTNGIHEIAWGVIDNLGRPEGIGSRYFWVLN